MLFLIFWIIFTIIILNCFSGRLPISFHLFGLVGFYLALSSITYFFVISLFLMGGAMILSCWLFRLKCPGLEFASSWVEPGLGAELRTSVKPHTNSYSLGPKALCYSSALYSVTLPYPPQEVRSNAWPVNHNSTAHVVQQKQQQQQIKSNSKDQNKKNFKKVKLKTKTNIY